MTELLERALDAVRRQPAEVQDRVADAIPALVGADDAAAIPEADRAAVLAGAEQVRSRDFAPDDEIAAIFREFGR